ncbi:WhiB family transcriptional regulator [Pseudonocardia terrae]|uniref:WhiB family transcriptional regulator n=1 Tax=Pseudonocardia terrae TaxID=2905831 RepID=UPI0035582D6C
MSADWRAQAACVGEDPELFFPVVEEGPLCEDQVTAAKKVCARCPVRDACLEWSTLYIHVGIAGGLTAEERRCARVESLEPLKGRVRRPSPRDDIRAAGFALIAQGESTQDVAARCGVTDRTVERWRAAISA